MLYQMRILATVEALHPYIRVMELPTNSLIPSRFLLQCYTKKTNRIRVCLAPQNQTLKYILNDQYPNWRENASIMEQCATVPSDGNHILTEINNMHNGRI